MRTKSEIIKSVKKMVVIFSIVVGLGLMIFIPPCSAQVFPYFPPTFFTPFYYPGYVPIVGTGLIDPLSYFYPSRTAAIVTSTLLLSSLFTAPAVPATTTLLGLSTAITLASTGGGINTTTLALLASTPVPTAPTTTPTIGTTTLLLLGGVNTTTLLLLGI